MSNPTAAAMRGGYAVMTDVAFGRGSAVNFAASIDNATGLPELIEALDEVRHAYILEVSPTAWLGVMRIVDDALRIAREGRS